MLVVVIQLQALGHAIGLHGQRVGQFKVNAKAQSGQGGFDDGFCIKGHKRKATEVGGTICCRVRHKIRVVDRDVVGKGRHRRVGRGANCGRRQHCSASTGGTAHGRQTPGVTGHLQAQTSPHGHRLQQVHHKMVFMDP